MLEKGSYVPWASRFMRCLDNKQKEGERMRHSIKVGLCERKMIQNPDNPDDLTAKIIEPLSKMTESNNKQYFLNIRVMNFLLQGIPNDIYNSVDACKTAKQMWERIRWLMHGSEKTKQQRHLRLVDEFENFVAVEGESLSSVYERLTTLVNVIERNNIRPISISINTKFLNSLQPKWSKYVTMTHQNANIKDTDFDDLFDTLSQYEPHVIASRAKKAARNHDPLTLVAHLNVSSSHSHASPSYSHSPQPYYVIHPSSVIDYEEDYQREIQEDAQEDKLTTAMMLLARTITQRYSTLTNNHLHTSSNIRNQTVIQDGRVDIQSKNVGYARNVHDSSEANSGKSNVQCYNCNVKGHYARDCPQPKLRDAKYFREQMLLAMKDEVGGNLNEEENDCMLDNHYGDDSLEELNTITITDVNASQIHLKSRIHSESVHEHMNHAKIKTAINTFDDDQIDSSIIFDDPYVENNSREDEHDSNAHDQSVALESLIYNVQHQQEVNELIENFNQNTYAYGDVCAKTQDLLMTVSKLKANLVEQAKNVNTKFDKSSTLEKLVCVTPLNKNKDLNLIPKVEIKADKSKPVISCSTSKNEQNHKPNANVIARGISVSRSESKDTNSKKRVLLNTKSKSTSKDVKKSHISFTSVANKNDTMNSNVPESKTNVLKAKTVNVVHDGSNLVCVSCGKDVYLISHDKCVARYVLSQNSLVIQIFLWIVDSGCSKHMTGNLKLLSNFVEKFMGTVRFGNDNFVAITGYGDYVQDNLTICHVYYVEDFGHNLFSGEDLLTGSRKSNLYTISISKMATSSPICLMSKDTSTKSWLWHLRFSHLNFGTINQLSKIELVDGLLRFKYDKYHLCSACEQGNNKKATFPSKLVPSINSKLELLHMDLCGPMKVEIVNGKRYILVIVDDYS
ncbi:integrase, catalytic region, zinc finger, CCHC-type containing protein [Tanacetum coccineum]|uniref:Integrase, catalytic region, zinc finger, CCHC-type containing protein n=1 Tax=Tanacetum coccineum TaxID=301880 RepID=A0ABQ5ECE4_9ASTR